MSDSSSLSQIAKTLLRRSRQGALATLTPDGGAPYCSLVAVASDADGAPILLISRLAVHTQNVLCDPRISLMLDERGAGDPLEGSRIMVAGTAAIAGEEAVHRLRRRYLNAHPSAEVFVDFKDFSFFKIAPTGLHLVAGFGRIVDMAPERFLTDISSAQALIDAEQDAIEHMNADHADALSLYATRLLDAGEGRWRCTGIDPDGLDLMTDRRVLRLDFPRRITTPAALRKMLKELAEDARAKVEDEAADSAT